MLFSFILITNHDKYIHESAEAPAMVEAQKFCERSSGTWSGVCGNNGACRNQCINLERAHHGSCNYRFPYHRCICYFPC
ncbi:hypothetical protein CARUB_v10021242mg [Capsella rubella]|uniref:Knottins-like domain-containing protein n=1 Tax=Capsella rubella TaxID=81985 RepID=R0IGN3_9BRAS|nr:hypothetical protein CARUB_v10021242mg [Capsella rubella]